MAKGKPRIAEILRKYEDDLVAEWIKELHTSGSSKENRISENELFGQAIFPTPVYFNVPASSRI